MVKKGIDKKRYKKDLYYKYYLKTGAFLKRTGVIVSGRWMYLSIIIGIVSALGASLFMVMLQYFKEAMLTGIVGYAGNELEPIVFLPGMKKWLILILPAAGAFVSGIIAHKFAPDAKGHGTGYVIRSFHKENGNIPFITPIVKIIATVLVIGTGGSAGREGPVAQIGAGFASFLGKRIKMTIKERRIMVLSGAGAGISALFGAPLGGAIFATEVLYKNHDLEAEALIPSVISSIVSFSVFRAVMGKEHLFNISDVAFRSGFELLPYAILGLMCAIVGVYYVKIFDYLTDEFEHKIKVHPMFLPAIGGFLVGAMGLFLPQVLAGGYGYIQMAFDGRLPLYLMIVLVLGKILATSFTIGSGGSGGVFAPSLFIGAMLGGSVGGLLQSVLPETWMPMQSAFVVVGMGGFFAGVARVPLSSIFMVSEMTGGYELLVPMMLVSSMAFLLNRKGYTLYREQAKNLLDSPAHKGDFEIDILQDLRVDDVVTAKDDIITIPRTMPLIKVIDIITKTKQDTFAVVDEKKGDKLVGIFTLEDIRGELNEQELLGAAVADDVADRNFLYVTMDEDLHSAMNKFILKDYDALPILDKKTKKFLGLVTRTNFIRVYNKRFAEMKKNTL